MGVDISVVMTLHAEGRIVHRTFRALRSAITRAQHKGLTVEIVAVMDRVSDSVLIQTVRNWSSIFDGTLSIYHVDFGAISLNRNFGVQKSTGDYISIHDGDDLYGEHWLHRAYSVCSADPANIAHPAACFSFPIRPFIVRFPQNPLLFLGLMKGNKWPSPMMAHRDVFTRFPYVKDDLYFAYQDWLWNCQTAAEGYHHLPVAKTVMALRQKPPGRSLWQSTIALNKVVRPNKLFKKFFLMAYSSSIAQAEKSAPKFNIKQMLSTFLERHLIRSFDSRESNRFDLYKFIIDARKTLWRKVKRILKIRFLPDWMVQEFDHLSKIEPTLSDYQSPQILLSTPNLHLIQAINRQMSALVKSVSARVYIIDGLDCNDLTTAMQLYLRSVEQPVFVITTGKSKNKQLDLLPDGSVHIDIGNIKLHREEKLVLMHRLLLESDLDFIHIFGSKLAFEMLYRHGGSLGRQNIFATLDHTALVLRNGTVAWQGGKYDLLVDYFTGISTNSVQAQAYLQQVFGMQQDDVSLHRLPHMDNQLSLQFQADSKHRRSLREYLAQISDIADKPNEEKNQSWNGFQTQVHNFYYRHKHQA